MLAHFWRDSEINLMPQSGQIGKYTIPKGYVNASQMAKANSKLLGDYTRLKSTKEYLQALENDMGIPISLLIIEVKGYANEQSTWVHPEIAIDLARWVSVSFRIWANRTLMKVMLASEIEVVQEQTPQTLAPSHEAAQLALLVGEFAGLEKSLTAQLAVNAATRVNPALKPAADELKSAIAITNVSDDAYLKPTDMPHFETDLFLYHTVRDNIHSIQKRLGISGVRTKNISVRDRLFSYPTIEDQLVTLESDRATLQQAVPEIITYFVSLVQIRTGYRLFLVDKKEQKTPASTKAVENAASKAVIAEIYTESYNWELTGTNCWRGKSVERLDPDQIRLTLHLDWDENKFIFFEAQHPDLSRFP